MLLNICIIPDKFKGTLTAREAAHAMEKGWHKVRPQDHIERLPMSDGGDGFGEVFGDLLQARVEKCKSVDASHHPIETRWWFQEETGLAIIESAEVIGLAMLESGKFHPFELDTRGLGLVLLDAAAKGASKCVIGIGGSATNDGGFGMARAMGWQFQNRHGALLDRWTDLHTLDQIHPPENIHIFKEMTVAVDVQNPLLGPKGCSRIYGPQKGLRPEDYEFSERCLGALARTMERQGYSRHSDTPGAGAAGGLGYGLLSFCDANPETGFEMFAHHTRLEDRIKRADLVLTAEGGIDQQTLMGKGVGEIGIRCRNHGVPCLAFAGQISDPDKARQLFLEAYALTPEFTSLEDAMSNTGPCLEGLVNKAAQLYNPARTKSA